MVVPIVAIPASIEAGLAPYRDLFPRINLLAQCLVQGPAQSSINKAITQSPWSGEAVNQRRL